MSTDVRALYETALRPRLEALEPLRRRARFWTAITSLVLVAGTGGTLIAEHAWGGYGQVLGIAVVGLVSWLLSMPATSAATAYRTGFKRDIARAVFKVVLPEAKYSADGELRRRVYEDSGLFREEISGYGSDDLVRGRIGQTEFECAEVKTTRTRTDSRGRTSTVTVFEGLLFHADFNKHLKGRTFVLPDAAERRFGTLARRFQSRTSEHGGRLVRLEDPGFETRFKVYSNDEVEARYVLTPTIMQNLVRLADRASAPVSMSFVDDRVFVAVEYGRPLFEPRVWRTGATADTVDELASIFGFIRAIIEDLDLNTRIWTKGPTPAGAMARRRRREEAEDDL